MTEVMSDMAEARGDLIQVKGALDTVEFHGVMVAEVNTDSSRSPRWTEMTLYRITDGPNTGKYVLSIVGCTVVYHRHRSSCNTGVEVTAGELPPDAEPCERCAPPAAPGPADPVDLEEEWRSVQTCDTAAAVVEHLRSTNRGRRTGSRGTGLSRPAENLLQRAARVDPQFDASRFVERL